MRTVSEMGREVGLGAGCRVGVTVNVGVGGACVAVGGGVCVDVGGVLRTSTEVGNAGAAARQPASATNGIKIMIHTYGFFIASSSTFPVQIGPLSHICLLTYCVIYSIMALMLCDAQYTTNWAGGK